jgi:2-polyprenyl-3-methyl-5-hydroxy-6-metoxy-1,4-benzoquinol methylase
VPTGAGSDNQWEAQRAFDSQAGGLLADTTSIIGGLLEGLERAQAEIRSLHREVEILRRQTIGVRMATAAEATRYHERERETPTTAQVASLRDELATVLERLGIAAGSGADIDYVGFEDRFRGKSQDLREEQRRYLSLFPNPSDAGTIVDIGCGRGEMLQLLIEAGHRVVGVDTDTDMVNVCQSKALPAVQDDGLHYLEGLASNSLKGVFCAQVVEHLLTSELERFLRLAFERLRPSGVLVVETINPRSLYALGNHFFADTTHVRPVHPETLRFLCEQMGFATVDLEERSLHPWALKADGLVGDELGDAVGALLRNVFGFQDYVIVATK